MIDIFFLGNCVDLVINKYTCGRFEEWDNTVFQLNSKSLVREAELRLSRPPEFYRSEALQEAAARSTKIVCQAELFGWDDHVESRNLLKSLFTKRIVKVRMLHTNRDVLLLMSIRYITDRQNYVGFTYKSPITFLYLSTAKFSAFWHTFWHPWGVEVSNEKNIFDFTLYESERIERKFKTQNLSL